MYIIEDISLKGDGISRKNDPAPVSFFFPGTCIGEHINPSYPLTSDHSRCSDFQIIKPSPDRIDMPCPHASYCSGCSYQHIAYNAQLSLKSSQLSRIMSEFNLGLIEVVPSKLEYRYRNRVTLLFDEMKAGFFKNNKSELFQFSSCLLLEKDIEEKALEISKADRIPGYYGVTVYKNLNDEIQVHYLRKQYDSAEFLQVNRWINRELISFVRDCIETRSEELQLLDLYCGNGNFSFQISDLVKSCLGLDISSPSISHARKRAKEIGLTDFNFESIAIEKARDAIIKASKNANLLIIDPPRKGLKKEAEFIASVQIPMVIYISCNPVTCRSDLREFLKRGYIVSTIKGFDMFPQTPHIETAVFLQKPSL